MPTPYLVRLLLLGVFAIVLLLPSSFSSAFKPEIIEVTDPQDLKDLTDVTHLMEKIVKERNACKATAKDYKQECICDKSKEYLAFAEKNQNLISTQARAVWFDAILSYKDKGQTKRTSIRRFSQVENGFSSTCLPQADGTFKADHEWDKPELIVKNSEDIEELYRLFENEKKIGIATSQCITQTQRTYEQCRCVNGEKIQILLKRIELLDKAHPEWNKHIIVYTYNNDTVKMGWEGALNKLRENANACKK